MFTFNIHISLLVVFVALSLTNATNTSATSAALTNETAKSTALGNTSSTYSYSATPETTKSPKTTISRKTTTSRKTATSPSALLSFTNATNMSATSTALTTETDKSTTLGNTSSTYPYSATPKTTISTETTTSPKTATASKTTTSSSALKRTNISQSSIHTVTAGGTITNVLTVVSSSKGSTTTVVPPSKVTTTPKPLECYEYNCQNESCIIQSNRTCSTTDTSCFITNTYVNGSVVNTTGGCSNVSNCSAEKSENSQNKKTVCCLENQCNTDELFKPNSTKSNGAQTHTKPSYNGNGIGILRAGVSSVVAPVIWIALSKVYVLFWEY